MALRWCAAGMLEADHQFRRVNGHLRLPKLRAASEGVSRTTVLPLAAAPPGGARQPVSTEDTPRVRGASLNHHGGDLPAPQRLFSDGLSQDDLPETTEPANRSDALEGAR
jgi:hypothetical protein